jgi:hypothetical protein
MVATFVRGALAQESRSTSDLATQVGISVHQLRRMLRGETPMPTEIAEDILDAIGMEMVVEIRARDARNHVGQEDDE